MLTGIRIVGTLIVHELDNRVFHFRAENRCLTLRGELHYSDRVHQIAAHIIARELNVLVIWQDMIGMKHLVEPDTILDDMESLLNVIDPRDQEMYRVSTTLQ